ncbi:hypothetical protein ACFXPI_11100 [Streptomyces sp. NPDC059104]|uniref:hypothetical protein n=1 Tax=Streptomyces sp. NPDC059104 TaxID=3346729 RepID=UPI0036A48866
MARAVISEERRLAIAAWLQCNGIDPADVPIDSTIVVNEKTITLDVFARAGNGAQQFDPVADGPVIERRTVPCQSQPPAAWPA